MKTITIEQLIKDIERFDISVDFRDKETTLLAEVLLENLEDHGRIKKINNYPGGVNIIFKDKSESLQILDDDKDSFESLIDDCAEYQKKHKLNLLSSETIIEIFDRDYDELD
jgi:hypothetical protein